METFAAVMIACLLQTGECVPIVDALSPYLTKKQCQSRLAEEQFAAHIALTNGQVGKFYFKSSDCVSQYEVKKGQENKSKI